VCTIICLVVVYGCRHQDMAPNELPDANGMKASVLTKVPIGTPVAEARRIMEAEGFSSRMVQQETFPELNIQEKIDYLQCERVAPLKGWIERRWRVIMVIQHGSVSDVLVWMSDSAS